MRSLTVGAGPSRRRAYRRGRPPGASLGLLLWIALATAAELVFAGEDGRIGFDLSATLHEVRGVARTFTGRYDPAVGRGELTVVVRSMATGLGPRDARMLNFALDAAQYPAVRFQVEATEGDVEALASGQGRGNVALLGQLTIRDVTRPVRVPAAFAWEGARLRLVGRYELRWADYGVPDPSIVVSLLQPDMAVSFDVLARPPSPTP